AVYPQPMHLAAAAHFITPHNRYVILDVTGYYTRTTASTGIQIDCHYPFMTGLLVLIPKIISLVRIRPSSRIVAWVLLILRKGGFADNITAFNRMVRLRLRQFVGATSFGELSCCIELQRTIYQFCKRICIFSNVISCFADLRTAITHRN